MNDRLILALAQGFGIGRVAVGPGTFGSLAGLLWFVVLLSTRNFWWYLAGSLMAIPLCVWICGQAERILGQPDPSSVVLDEIVAVPLCLFAWVAWEYSGRGKIPSVEGCLSHPGWIRLALVFVLFRVFDIAKPWPVRPSQRLPGGWGVTVDDLLAAVYVNLVQAPFLAWSRAGLAPES